MCHESIMALLMGEKAVSVLFIFVIIHTLSTYVKIVEIKGPESWWIAKSITISRVVNQSKVNAKQQKGVVE